VPRGSRNAVLLKGRRHREHANPGWRLSNRNKEFWIVQPCDVLTLSYLCLEAWFRKPGNAGQGKALSQPSLLFVTDFKLKA